MKTKSIMLITVVIVASIFAATKPMTPPTAWYALEEGTSAYHVWTPSDPNFEFDLATSILPEGFQIAKVGGNVEMRLDPGPAGEQWAMIVVQREQEIGGSWNGPKVQRREESVIEIIRYSNTITPFFGGQGYVILSASAPTP